jgi:hypothetical protein
MFTGQRTSAPSGHRQVTRLFQALELPLSRREMLRHCLYGAAGLLLLRGWGLCAATPAPTARARSVIHIWLCGGPCHIDLFDPKPEAGRDFCGPFQSPLETNVSGIRIGQLLPQLARQADKYCLLRSLTHDHTTHESAAYVVHTGRQPGGQHVYPPATAVSAYFQGNTVNPPGFVSDYLAFTEPLDRSCKVAFRGTRSTLLTRRVDPTQPASEVESIAALEITKDLQQHSYPPSSFFNTLSHTLPGDATVQVFYASEEQAHELSLGDAAKLFDLGQEPEDLRDRYGRNTFGQSCLLARRLVEQGVPYITITSKGWDTHKHHFQIMHRKLPEFDQGLATLLQDLSDRGLLSQTIVWVSGEFGRTPRIQWDPPWNGGRNHFARAFAALVAGGGFKAGQVLGATNRTGEEVTERPIHPVELLSTIDTLLGIDPNASLPHPEGPPVPGLPGPEEGVPSLRLLREII